MATATPEPPPCAPCSARSGVAPRRQRGGDLQQILVFRPSAVGDFVFALPCLWSLRTAYPKARLVYVGQQWHARFLVRGRTPVDDVLVLPPCPGINASDAHGAALDSFIGDLRKKSFDLALQIYGGGRIANPLVKRFGARTTIGFRAQDAPGLDRHISYAPLQNRRLQLLEMAALAGAPPELPNPELLILPEDRDEIAAILHTLDRPFVLLNPGASDPRRRWPAIKFGAAGDGLASQGFQVLVHGTASEAALCRSVIESMRSQAIDLSGRLSLGGLCALMARAALLVSNDTGPLHLATATGAPAVGIYWLGNLVESMPLQQHLHRAAWAVDTHCPVCGKPNLCERCEHEDSFVDGVTVRQVMALAEELLAISTSMRTVSTDSTPCQ